MCPARIDRSWLRWPAASGSPLAHGADYNPEQWPRDVWDEDVELMREAGVNVVSLAIFSWARVQPAEDRWDFGWLDEVMDLLHRNGVGVDLATATASPPPWLTAAHPEVLPVTRNGETVWPGARQHWRPTSPVFRRYALRLVEAIGTRYADHPALVAWHVSNELGCHNVYDYSDDAAQAFRAWLQSRYETVDALNHAWGTAFWSQGYGAWSEILPPRLAASHPNPTQQLDFKRFSSDALKEHLRAEREVLRRLTPSVPVTTNFMVMGETSGMDYADWAHEVDFVSNDHYVLPGAQSLDELSFSASLTGHVAGGAPWFLMERSTNAVNWQPVNVPKKAWEMLRDSLTHVAHGADGLLLPVAAVRCGGGEVPLGHGAERRARQRRLPRRGGPRRDPARPRAHRRIAPAARPGRNPLRLGLVVGERAGLPPERPAPIPGGGAGLVLGVPDAGVCADVVPTGTPLAGYDVVVAPVLYVLPAALADELAAYVAGGGHLVTTYFSGIVDENEHAWPGAYPGALRSLLGIRIHEFVPLLDHESVDLDNGTVGTMWTDRIDVVADDVDVLARYVTGNTAGRAAVTSRSYGSGAATYVSTRLGQDGLAPVLRDVLARAGVRSELPAAARGRVELAVRTDGSHDFWFLINRTAEPVEVPEVDGELLVGERGTSVEPGTAPVRLSPRGVAVLSRQAR